VAVGALDDEDRVAGGLIDEDRGDTAGGLRGEHVGGVDAVAGEVVHRVGGEDVVADPGEHEDP
jgi:hypothetical protein